LRGRKTEITRRNLKKTEDEERDPEMESWKHRKTKKGIK